MEDANFLTLICPRNPPKVAPKLGCDWAELEKMLFDLAGHPQTRVS
jgi:hypothetical protein